MSLTNEQILAAHKANMETLFGLTTKAFEGVEKLVELNLTASRAALNEAASHTQAVLSVKDVQELMALQAGLLQPLAEKTASYSRHLYDIASGTGTGPGSSGPAPDGGVTQAVTLTVNGQAQRLDDAGDERGQIARRYRVAADEARHDLGGEPQQISRLIAVDHRSDPPRAEAGGRPG